ncbi:MAG: hypothetical protein KBG36_05535 [Candidatus Marinimicrobia bacterium]|nr:hypothetical protein [Candidatus Neomarinimicrobiota bacterium]
MPTQKNTGYCQTICKKRQSTLPMWLCLVELAFFPDRFTPEGQTIQGQIDLSYISSIKGFNHKYDFTFLSF